MSVCSSVNLPGTWACLVCRSFDFRLVVVVAGWGHRTDGPTPAAHQVAVSECRKCRHCSGQRRLSRSFSMGVTREGLTEVMFE